MANRAGTHARHHIRTEWIGVTDFQLVNGDQRISTEGVFGNTSDKLSVTLGNVDRASWTRGCCAHRSCQVESMRRPRLPAQRTNRTWPLTFKSTTGSFATSPIRRSAGGELQRRRRGRRRPAAAERVAVADGKGPRPSGGVQARKRSGDRFDLHVDTSTIDLGLVQGLTPRITQVKGTMQAKVDVTGASDNPRRWAVTVKDGTFKLQDTGVSYAASTADRPAARSDPHRRSPRARQPESAVLGERRPQRAGLQVGEVSTLGDGLQGARQRDGNLRLNSDLRLTGTLAHPRIEGELDVSTGSLNLDAILARIGNSPYSTTATEVASVAEGTGDTESSWRKPQLSVHVVIPDDLIVKARDLRTSGSGSSDSARSI